VTAPQTQDSAPGCRAQVCLLCLSAYAFAGVALIYTLEFSHADLQLAVQQAGTQAAAGLQQAACAAGTTEVECVASAVNTTAGGQVLLNLTAFNSTNVTVVDGSDTSLMWPMMWYHIFCALWCMNLYNALGTMIIAGAVAEVFWTKDRVATECAHKLPTIDSLCYILKYHFGSAALGALIIALVQMVRLVLMYIQQQTEEMAESSRAVKCVLKAIQCCMWCFEKCIKYLSHNAYVMVAIDGQTFCHAAWTSVRAARGGEAPVAFFTVNRVCRARLCGRAGHLAARTVRRGRSSRCCSQTRSACRWSRRVNRIL
jgi:hypothetical protein